jgi:hypothetical protein
MKWSLDWFLQKTTAPLGIGAFVAAHARYGSKCQEIGAGFFGGNWIPYSLIEAGRQSPATYFPVEHLLLLR